MPVRNYIRDAKTCKEFKGKWSAKTNRCSIDRVKQTINQNDIDAALDKLNDMMEGYGVEPVRGRWVDHYYQDINLLYVNKGDTYKPTVIYDTLKQTWYVGTSWGDIIESEPTKRFEI